MSAPNYNLFNALVYEIVRLLCERSPSLRFNALVKRILTHCFDDWVQWKTHLTMMEVDQQVESLQQRWEQGEAEKSVEKFSEIFPHAKVTPHEKFPGAVLIEHEDGAMEIKSPWSDPG